VDALRRLDFPDAFFDLVNLRFGVSFLRTWDWPKLLAELLRVTLPGGVVRVTESEVTAQSNSPALTSLCKQLRCAHFRSGHLFEEKSTGVIDHLQRLFNERGCKAVQTKAYTIEYRAGTTEGETFYEDVKLGFQTLRPFIQKWGCDSTDYVAIYHQALKEMHRPDFCATWNILTVWGNKSR
jgi:ubiquinone/menaquinone biosynthesis C-methylase UbiE